MDKTLKSRLSAACTAKLLPLLAVIFAAIPLASCATASHSAPGGDQNVLNVYVSKKPFSTMVDDWTRTGNIYYRLNLVLNVKAVYRGPEIIREEAKLAASADGLDDARKKEILGDAEKNIEEFYEFYASVYAGQSSWNDISSPSSIWTVALDTGSGPIRPVSVYRMTGKNMPLVEHYRFISPWSRLYRIRFPKPEKDLAPSKLSLTFGSVMGNMELDWLLKSSSAGAN